MPHHRHHHAQHQTDTQNDDVAHPDKPSQDKLDATDKAADATIKRMTQTDHKVGGTEEPAPAPAKTASPGDSGMLTKELKTKLDGVDVTVPLGTYVVVKEVKGKDLVCKVYSSFGGKEAVIPGDSFKNEPALGHKSDPGHTSEPRDYTYQEYTSILWDGAPKAGDVAQGRLGDCYLMSSMGAVAAANPKAISSLFEPATPNQQQYTVNLHVDDGKGGLKKQAVVVDTNLPTRVQDVQMNAPTYALMGQSVKQHNVPLWPALLEKAYAQLMGGYDVVGDNGGSANVAMEAITGQKRSNDPLPGSEKDVIQRFKEFQAAGKAIVCGTLDRKHAASQVGFNGADGGFSANLKTDQGEAAEVLPNTLRVSDQKGKAARASDDGVGKMIGPGVSGDVRYANGGVTLKYEKDKGPAAAADLKADFDWRGVLDKALNVHAWHAYIFEKVEGDKLIFKNPWGFEHPLPIPSADFLKLFNSLNSNQVPRDKPKDPA